MSERRTQHPAGDSDPSVAVGSGRAGAPALKIEGLRKAFGDTQALTSVDLTAQHGEIHAIVGENGSGKSTLVKAIAGVLHADGGSIAVAGREVPRPSPQRMTGAGVAVVFQEVLTVPSASVVDNVFLGHDRLFRARLGREAKIRRCAELLGRLCGRPVDPLAEVDGLPLATRQWITVARALVREPQVLILDESTAALDLADAARLLSELELLRDQGVCVLLVTHRLTELRHIADRATVLRDGSTVTTLERAELTEQRLVALMTGEALEALHPTDAPARTPGTVRLRVAAARLAPGADPVSTEVRRGEIVGLAGLDGEGQATFLRALAGIAPLADGAVEAIDDSGPQTIGNERAADRAGLVYVPGDRKAEGILPHQSILENFGLPTYGQRSRVGLVGRRATRRELRTRTAPLKLKAGRATDPITSLSGGNQQKVIIARWLAREPTTILLNDPTRGVDIITKRDLYGTLRETAQQGATVVFLSTEIEELTGLCDRILVFRHQTLSAELAGTASAQDVMAAMFGVSGDVESAVEQAMSVPVQELADTPEASA